MLRSLPLFCVAAFITAACSEPTGQSSSADGSRTAQQTEMTYDVQITGVTFAGNTNFLLPTTQFMAVEQFSRPGTLLLSRSTVEGGPGVGLAIGSIASPQAGNLAFASHSSMLKVVSGASQANRNAGLAVARVTLGGGRLDMQMITGGTGHPVSRTMQLNSFVWRSGLAAPKQILDGGMILELSDNDRRISGEAVFLGGGYIEPGTYAVKIEFQGMRR
jgi:hypothetical protein